MLVLTVMFLFVSTNMNVENKNEWHNKYEKNAVRMFQLKELILTITLATEQWMLQVVQLSLQSDTSLLYGRIRPRWMCKQIT